MNFDDIKTKEKSIFNSKAGLIAKKFEDFLKVKKIQTDQFNSWEEISELFLKAPMMQKLMTQMGVNLDEVMIEIKNANIASIIPPAPVVKEPKKIEEIKTEYKKLEGLREGEAITDPRILKQIEEALLIKEVNNLFLDSGEGFNNVYEKTKKLSGDAFMDTDEYYYKFAEMGVVESKDEVTADLADLRKTKELIKKDNSNLNPEDYSRVEKSYKISEIVERALALASSDWYGGDIDIDVAPEWVDLKKGIDDILRLKKTGSENDFLGLGIDATYNGLFSEKYKEKFFNLLTSISHGYKNNIKYFKNHEGELMPEFSVPKVVLFFNIEDVKKLIFFVKHFEDQKEREDFKENFLKYSILNQIITQSEILQEFADRNKNNISDEYGQFLSSVKRWLMKNKKIGQMVEQSSDERVALHMKFLVNSFEKNR